MTDPNTVNSVLYALSTVAQTCAALAALVGALALFKLQVMREGHAETERVIRGLLGPQTVGPDTPREQVLVEARAVLASSTLRVFSADQVQKMGVAVDEWDQFEGRYGRAVWSLLIFETWNLLAILGSLIGFLCVLWLAAHWISFAVLLVVCSVGTVVVTGGALYVMARPDAPATSTLRSRISRVSAMVRSVWED